MKKIAFFLFCILSIIGYNTPLFSQHATQQQQQNIPLGECNNLGGESGWGPWKASIGDYVTDKFSVYKSLITYSSTGLDPATVAGNRFVLTNGGIDACTPGTTPGSPVLPKVAPNFGNRSIQLGTRNENGDQGGCGDVMAGNGKGCVERLSCSMLVTPADTNFIYAYAIFFNYPTPNGTNEHTSAQVPFAEIYMLTPNGDTVSCSHQKYMGDTAGQKTPTQGLYPSKCTITQGYDASYKPWTVVGVNLAKYVGQTISINIVNADCSQGGHYCHSYWDFQCPPLTTSETPFCVGQTTTLCAPVSSLSNNQYNYQWFVNTKAPGKIGTWTLIPGKTGQCIEVTPQVGDTFNVKVLQPSKCNFWIPFIPTPTDITPLFDQQGFCGKFNFTDKSTVSPVSSTNNVVEWDWSFPGGTPSSSTAQNPSVSYPPGTYTVSLVVKSTAGCVDSIKQVITTGGYPEAAFTGPPICLGKNTSILNGSVSPNGDPIVSWNWTMADGTPASSTDKDPVINYNTAGTHSITLVVTTKAGCTDTITQQVIIYDLPKANFSGPTIGCAPVCNSYKDLSTCKDGNLVSWKWTFPGGTPSSSSLQYPIDVCYNTPGSYGASLIIVSNYGCKDSVVITPLVTVVPRPKADFDVAPVVAPTINPIFNFNDLWTKPEVKYWEWDFGDGSPKDTSLEKPTHSYSATATENDFYTFNICLRVRNELNCWDSICKPIELIPEFEFYIPNSFTPNEDGRNEFFFGKSRGVKEYKIWVFDRWGNLIWDCSQKGKNTDWDRPSQDGMSSSCQWNGVVQNKGLDMNGRSKKLSQEDVYVWKVKLTDIFDKKHSYIGHVSIVR